MANLTSRDRDVLKDLHHFRGLFSEAVKKRHFKNKNYAFERLSDLYNARYLNKERYYIATETSARKMGTLYYLTEKGADAIDASFYRVSANKGYLKKQYILSKIYEKYDIQKLDSPVTSFIYQDKQFYIVANLEGAASLQELIKKMQKNTQRKHFIITKRLPESMPDLEADVQVIIWNDNEELIAKIDYILDS
ncbi:replication-relaxation family protein [Natranaerobius thermophilus]|uniref:Uncharacterized protein n=1 Tax=Natranaerobius thermophilus (strain ATCC BAA-1301 / DSM 18059 / JW/NM-WN-LF) TaxID=457570 RepID=B2A782_NATTJ|nr:replication-relaxation family protein [Natranaerobius thermophilus]ACB84276.1 hypothetical protein Nther_0683 [Natranaerobius thermophilus JW/NM-WN-LF]